MLISSIDNYVHDTAIAAGFSRARILSPYQPEKLFSAVSAQDNHWEGSPSLLVVALPHGNRNLSGPEGGPASIAPFARRNYYAEAVFRLKELSKNFRVRFGGTKAQYRILCNSPIPEKPLALACGLGWPGRNGLIITPEAGSLVILAAMTLPFELSGDMPLPGVFSEMSFHNDTDPVLVPRLSFPACTNCGDRPACVAACPTAALSGAGVLQKDRCIQWYASGNGESVPGFIAEKWDERLYGCTNCQDACPYNKKPVKAVETNRGRLPDYFSSQWVIQASDEEIRKVVKGTALGMNWLGPEALRRNAFLTLRRTR